MVAHLGENWVAGGGEEISYCILFCTSWILNSANILSIQKISNKFKIYETKVMSGPEQLPLVIVTLCVGDLMSEFRIALTVQVTVTRMHVSGGQKPLTATYISP